MKSEKGALVLYVSVACLFLLIVGITAYIGVSNKQAAQIAELKRVEESYNTSDVTAEELYKSYDGGDVVPIYTPEQFAKVGSGEEVYVKETGKFYTFSIDKTYMFYGVSEDLTDKIKEMLKEQVKEEVKIQIADGNLSGGGEVNQKPCEPILATNMVAVYWSTDGGQTASITGEGATPIYSKIDANGNPSSKGSENPNFKKENWYKYTEGYNLVDTKTSRWANGVTDDGSYWVWVPRFKYKILNKPGANGTYVAGTVDVKFISVEEKSGKTLNGSTYVTTKNIDGEFITTDTQGYIIHPAFEDGSKNGSKAQNQANYVEYNNGEWDSELSGFWIAKYEMSAENAAGTAQQPGNKVISDSIILVSKANRSCWRSISTGNSYKNCYNYNRENESHMLKNSEWGAMAYLTHSKYGRNGNEATLETSYTTATVGELESSTGNIYGIYGINGGAWERTASWDTKSTSGYLTSYGNIELDGIIYGKNGAVSSKYATAYENGTGTDSGILAKTVGKTGDAIKEVWCASDRSWFNDYCHFACSAYPFFTRGGRAGDGEAAGVFASYGTAGEPNEHSSFRAALVPSV